MSRFDDVVAADTARMVTTDEAGTACTYYPQGSATGFAAIVAVGDNQDQQVAIAAGIADRRTMPVLGLLAPLSAGIAIIEGDARPPRLGDRLVFTDAAIAGEWTITAAIPDQGGGVQMTLMEQTTLAAGRRQVGP